MSGCPSETDSDVKTEAKTDSHDLSVPIISLKTVGPKHIESDRDADYKITVRNVSSKQDASLKLIITHTKSAKFRDAQPFPQNYKEGVLEYDIDALPRLQEQTFTLKLWPPEQGSIDVKARYVLKTETKIATHVKRPQIRFDVTGPNEVDINNDAPYSITITNPGDGVIRDLLIEPVFPQQVGFDDVDNNLTSPFTIKANEKKVLKFKLTGYEPGEHKLGFKLHISNMPAQIVQSTLRVHTRVPNVHFAGPAQHIVGENGDYTVIIENRSKLLMASSELKVVVPDFIRIEKISHPCAFTKNRNNQWEMVWMVGDLEPGKRMVYRMRGKSRYEGSGTASLLVSAGGQVVRQKEFQVAAVKATKIQPTTQKPNKPIELQPTPVKQNAQSKEKVQLGKKQVELPKTPVVSVKRVEAKTAESSTSNSVRFLVK